MSDDIALLINDRDLTQSVKSFDLHYDLFKGCNSFRADLDPSIKLGLGARSYKFDFRINGESAMRGFIDRVNRDISKSADTLQVMGRDMCQILHDSYVLYYKYYTYQRMDAIIRDIWDTSKQVTGPLTTDPQHPNGRALANPMALWDLRFFGIDHSTTGYTAENFQSQFSIQAQTFPMVTEFRTVPGESLYAAMSKLCNQYGYAIYNYPGRIGGEDVIVFHPVQAPVGFSGSGFSINGQLISGGDMFPYVISNFQRDVTGLQGMTSTLSGISGQLARARVLNVQFSSDITSYAKYLKLVGQCGDSLQYNPDESSFAPTVTSPQYLKVEKIESDDYGPDRSQWNGYKGLLKFQVIETNIPDTSVWYNEEYRQTLLNNALLKQNRALYNLKYTVDGLAPYEGGVAYKVNNLADVHDEFLDITATFLVYRVAFTGSKTGGMRTMLEMALPSGTSSTLQHAKWPIEENNAEELQQR